MMYALTNDCLQPDQLQPDQAPASRVSGVGLRALTSVEVGFIDNWAALADAFGMGAETGRVHALLFLADTAMTAAEVQALSGLERADVETVLARLLEYGAIEASEPEVEDGAVPGYVSVRDPWVWFGSTVRHRARQEFAPLLASIRSLHALADSAHRDGGLSEARLGRITRFTRFVDQVAKLLETFGGAGSSRPMMSAARAMARFMCG